MSQSNKKTKRKSKKRSRNKHEKKRAGEQQAASAEGPEVATQAAPATETAAATTVDDEAIKPSAEEAVATTDVPSEEVLEASANEPDDVGEALADDDAMLAADDLGETDDLADETALAATDAFEQTPELVDDAAILAVAAALDETDDLTDNLTEDDGADLGDVEFAAEDDDPVDDGERPELATIVESLIFAADRPLGARQIKQLTGAGKDALKEALDAVRARFADTGIQLVEIGGGFQFRTHPRTSRWVRKLLMGRPARLTKPMLETMAIVAYRQPVTRPEIEEIRGVDCGGTLRVLLERHLVRIVGKREEPGRPLLYGTTKFFLEFFNLKDLKGLPSLREFAELSEEHAQQVDQQFGEGASEMAMAAEQAQWIEQSTTLADDEDGAEDGTEGEPTNRNGANGHAAAFDGNEHAVEGPQLATPTDGTPEAADAGNGDAKEQKPRRPSAYDLLADRAQTAAPPADTHPLTDGLPPAPPPLTEEDVDADLEDLDRAIERANDVLNAGNEPRDPVQEQ